MTEMPNKSKVAKEDLVWFSRICIMIGIADKRAIENNVIDEEDLLRLHKIIEQLIEE